MPGRRAVHTKAFDRCVRQVRKRGDAANPYAVCSSSLGKTAVKKSHRRNPKKRVSTRRMPPALAKYWRARNRRLAKSRTTSPRRARRHHRNAAAFVIAARKAGDRTLYYDGGGRFMPRARAHVYHNERDAEATAYLLKESYPHALKGWEVLVAPG